MRQLFYNKLYILFGVIWKSLQLFCTYGLRLVNKMFFAYSFRKLLLNFVDLMHLWIAKMYSEASSEYLILPSTRKRGNK